MSKYCEYYATYFGPELVSVLVDGKKDFNLFEKIKNLYGEKQNWNEQIYEGSFICDDIYLKKEIKLNFLGKDARQHSFSGVHQSNKYIFNPPLWTPVSQLQK